MDIKDVLRVARPLQIFFSRTEDFPGAIIQFGEVGFNWNNLIDKNIPRHVGYLYPIYRQWFVCEVTGNGPDFNPIDKYMRKGSRILSIWEWQGFDSEKIENELEYLSLWIRRRWEKGYDWFGAGAASRWLKKVLPFLRGNPKKDFCSESVAHRLYRNGAVFPLTWLDNPPNPLELYQWFVLHQNEYRQVA